MLVLTAGVDFAVFNKAGKFCVVSYSPPWSTLFGRHGLWNNETRMNWYRGRINCILLYWIWLNARRRWWYCFCVRFNDERTRKKRSWHALISATNSEQFLCANFKSLCMWKMYGHTTYASQVVDSILMYEYCDARRWLAIFVLLTHFVTLTIFVIVNYIRYG